MSAKNIEDAYPLSPMQEGMLFHSLLAPGSGVYVLHVCCRLRNLDAAVFAQVWQQLIDRHSILRSAFVWKNVEKPLQVVGRQVGLPLEQQDWRGLSASAQEERFAAHLEADRKTGFNLMKAPLMRLALFQTGERDYQFLWSIHHILMDGWSTSLLLSDFLDLYQAVSHNGNHPGAPRRPYRDYIGWLQQQDLGAAEGFWRRTLKGFAEPTRLGIERSIDAELENNYEEQYLDLSESISAGLQKVGREQQVTLNTVVQGAWALLLSRYSGSEDVVFGATVSGRPASLAGVEEMVGLFINTLPVRVPVNSDEGVGGYLRRLQEQQVEVRQYEYSPLVEVQGWSEVGRGVRLFDTIVVFENYPVSAIVKESNGGLSVSDARSIEQSNYPLTLIGNPGTTLRLNLLYDNERYERASIARMLEHLETLLEGIALKPEQPLGALSLLSAAAREQILVAWNQTSRAYAHDCCLHELFEAQVARTPDAPAITFENQHLTYQQLNERANQLARHLQRLGVGPEVLVGVLMERSLEMVVALYAILKAGGAYVPLEPAYPRERLELMLNDLRVPVVLTQERFAGLLSDHNAVSLDAEWAEYAGEPVDNLGVALTPLNVAYVIYTSGSTGQPKGVMNTHLGICNRLLWMQEAYQLKAGEVVLQKTPFSFDVSVWEFFWPLLAGARLVVAEPEGHRDSAYLIDLIKREQVTTLHFVPSMLQVFLEDERARECASLKRVICSGEALSRELQERYYERMPGELHNLYGPTEAAVDVTYWACERETLRHVVPIGRPIANTQIYILDRRLEAVPVGVAGELFIGGVNLARGYLNRAELTAEKFIPHPYSRHEGERLYGTGDVVRWLADGNIEYLGRIDRQVKIRGFRIELEEIRLAVMQHPDVKEAVISTHGNSIEDRRLVAYIIAASERGELSGSDLRDYLKERLPEYMVPSAFVMLEKLPLTSNGKVDYRALPPPDGHNLGLKNEYVAPRTDVEQLLRNIWHEVIGIVSIGIHDNFFELGGHSILLLKVQRKIRERFEQELSLVELFKYPTIHLLTERLKRQPEAVAEPPSFQRSFDRAETRRELVSRQREVRKRNVAETSS